MTTTTFNLWTDGACRGNPGGPCGSGFVLVRADGSGYEIKAGEPAGFGTNNEVEWLAVVRALDRVLREGGGLQPCSVHLRLDSQLVQRQLTGEYEVKKPHLKPYYAAAMARIARFSSFRAEWIPREQNEEADALSNDGCDRQEALAARDCAEARLTTADWLALLEGKAVSRPQVQPVQGDLLSSPALAAPPGLDAQDWAAASSLFARLGTTTLNATNPDHLEALAAALASARTGRAIAAAR